MTAALSFYNDDEPLDDLPEDDCTYRPMPKALISCQGLSLAERLVLGILADLGRVGQIYCGLQWLSRQTNLSPSYLRRVIRGLKAAELLVVQHRNRMCKEMKHILSRTAGVGMGSTNVYVLTPKAHNLTALPGGEGSSPRVSPRTRPASLGGRAPRLSADVPRVRPRTVIENHISKPDLKKTNLDSEPRSARNHLSGQARRPPALRLHSARKLNRNPPRCAETTYIEDNVIDMATSTHLGGDEDSAESGDGTARSVEPGSVVDLEAKIAAARQERIARAGATVGASVARTAEARHKKAAKRFKAKPEAVATKPRPEDGFYDDEQAKQTPRGYLAAVWKETLEAQPGAPKALRWTGQQFGQAQQLLDRCDGDVEAVANTIRYSIKFWPQLKDRMFKGTGGPVPSLGFVLKLADTLVPEAGMWIQHAKTIDEYDSYGSKYAQRPRELQDRYLQASKDLKALGIMKS